MQDTLFEELKMPITFPPNFTVNFDSFSSGNSQFIADAFAKYLLPKLSYEDRRRLEQVSKSFRFLCQSFEKSNPHRKQEILFDLFSRLKRNHKLMWGASYLKHITLALEECPDLFLTKLAGFFSREANSRVIYDVEKIFYILHYFLGVKNIPTAATNYHSYLDPMRTRFYERQFTNQAGGVDFKKLESLFVGFNAAKTIEFLSFIKSVVIRQSGRGDQIERRNRHSDAGRMLIQGEITRKSYLQHQFDVFCKSKAWCKLSKLCLVSFIFVSSLELNNSGFSASEYHIVLWIIVSFFCAFNIGYIHKGVKRFGYVQYLLGVLAPVDETTPLLPS